MGKKYIIELEDEPFANCGSSGNALWRVKGCSSLIFDEKGLKKLTPYKKEKSSDSDIQIGDEVKCQIVSGLDPDRQWTMYFLVINTYTNNGELMFDAIRNDGKYVTCCTAREYDKSGRNFPGLTEFFKINIGDWHL